LNGTVSLQLVNGVDEVIYTAPSNLKTGSPTVKVTYTVTDQHNRVVALGTAFVGGNTNQSLTVNGDTTVILGGGSDTVALSGTSNAVLLGNGKDKVTVTGAGNTISLGSGNDTVVLNGTSNAVSLGNGNDIVTVSGGGNTISLGSGIDTVQGGTGDTIQLAGAGNLTVSGKNEMVFLGGGNNIVTDSGQGLKLNIGPTAGTDSLAHFASDLSTGVIDLLGGIGGYTSASQAYAALQSDGHGGTLLPLGPAASLDILGVAGKQLVQTNNFHIG
jgi:Ca2+-binding RTX toxin-like protein